MLRLALSLDGVVAADSDHRREAAMAYASPAWFTAIVGVATVLRQ